ncbi:NAD(P)/FAD-dependent oxidoreductase [Streptococcus halichoeri]|uniref:NAD(P)/FAD-dependent oxidoreductase n=1 Tax=Streptococcus halichoeri TaxID=254785 RepID=UPI001357F981|nr:FAD-dependent oxidoreductase [Streptococcus halichoeri]
MRIAIIGAGIVGSTAAYYLSRLGQAEVVLFDEGLGQATKAAAGIICPWFSKRRNKAWYQLADAGAKFYPRLIQDLLADGYPNTSYQKTGVYVLKKDSSKLEELYHIALQRQHSSPIIGQLSLQDYAQASGAFPELKGYERTLVAQGAARVDGHDLCRLLQTAAGYPLYQQKVSLRQKGQGYEIAGHYFDRVILACGAWLGQLLEPLGYHVDVRPQKGQLLDYHLPNQASDQWPVVMPEGEIDIIPFTQGKVVVGASHENDQGFDISPDQDILNSLAAQASPFLPALATAPLPTSRVGIRAYTRDFLPFFGSVPNKPRLYVASGLGSTGLTVGPIIGQQLAKLALDQELDMAIEAYNPAAYLTLLA